MGKLAGILRARLDMLREDALAVAHTVEEAFRGEDEVNDEFLDAQLRAVFYALQDEGVLAIRRTEFNMDGRARRAYFWSVQEGRDVEDAPKATFDRSARMYARLDDDAWKRRKQVAS